MFKGGMLQLVGSCTCTRAVKEAGSAGSGI